MERPFCSVTFRILIFIRIVSSRVAFFPGRRRRKGWVDLFFEAEFLNFPCAGPPFKTNFFFLFIFIMSPSALEYKYDSG